MENESFEGKILRGELQCYYDEISALRDKLTIETNPAKRKSLVQKILDAQKRVDFFSTQTTQSRNMFSDALHALEQRIGEDSTLAEPKVKSLKEDSLSTTSLSSTSRESVDSNTIFDSFDEVSFNPYADLSVEQYLKRVQLQTVIKGDVPVTDLSNLKVIMSDYKVYHPLYATLRSYQKVGVKWIISLFNSSYGGLLADEPGVGKTVQTITALSSLFLSRKVEYVLLIVPATLQVQWLEMIRSWWPLIRCILLTKSSVQAHNPGLRGSTDISAFLFSLAEEIFQHRTITFEYGGKRLTVGECGTIFIASYEFAMRTNEDLNAMFSILTSTMPDDRALPIPYAIFDEVHYLKNIETKRMTALCKLRISCKLGLSATPIQNNLTEIYSLLNYLQPNILGCYEIFQQNYDIPIRKGSVANAKYEDIALAASLAQKLAILIKPYILRRLKSEVERTLPPKVEHLIFIKLYKEQEQLYLHFLKSDKEVLRLKQMLMKSNKIDRGITKLTMAYLIQLQHICDHPALLDKDRDNVVSTDRCLSARSCKLTYLLTKLKELWVTTTDKILVFCQGRMMLSIIERAIQELPCFSSAYLRMDGTTPMNQRPSLIDRFSTDPKIRLFLLTTKVGGLGLNLIAANHVFLMNPNWNPSIDDQSVERCWRISQTKKVFLYKVFTGGTIEEKIFTRQLYKRLLMSRVLDNACPVSSKYFKDDMFQLFTYEPPEKELKIITKETGPGVGHQEDKSTPGLSASKLNAKERLSNIFLDKICQKKKDGVAKTMQIVVDKGLFTFLRVQRPEDYIQLVDVICRDFCKEQGYKYLKQSEKGAPLGLFSTLGYDDEVSGDEGSPYSRRKEIDEDRLKGVIRNILEAACTAPNNALTLYSAKEVMGGLEECICRDILTHVFIMPTDDDVQTYTVLILKPSIRAQILSVAAPFKSILK